jgi:hypothetical protein
MTLYAGMMSSPAAPQAAGIDVGKELQPTSRPPPPTPSPSTSKFARPQAAAGPSRSTGIARGEMEARGGAGEDVLARVAAGVAGAGTSARRAHARSAGARASASTSAKGANARSAGGRASARTNA